MELCVRDVGDGEAGFGDVLEMGADVGEVDERHLLSLFGISGVVFEGFMD